MRLGEIDGDPGVRPSAHQFVAYAAPGSRFPTTGCPATTSGCPRRVRIAHVRQRVHGPALRRDASLWDGFANLVRPGLGLTAFGANVMNLPPDYETKAHDESASGQEELYVALAGSGAVLIGEERERVPLDPESAVRVSPGTSRVLASGSEGCAC